MSSRGEFWRGVVRRVNFLNDDERHKIIKLAETKIATPKNKYTDYVARDVPRTFVLFELPYDAQTMQPALHRVLNAISEAEDGYCQGMNFIAAVFLVQGFSEEHAYIVFLYLLKHKHLSQFFKDSSIFLNEYLAQFQYQLSLYLPELANRLEACGFSVYLYGVEWFTTIFSCSSKLDLTRAVLDMMLIGVEDVMFRVGLAVLKNVEAQLMGLQFEDLLHHFKAIVKQADTYQVVVDALIIPPHVDAPGGVLAQTARRSSKPFAAWPYLRHRTLGPMLAQACERGTLNEAVWERWKAENGDDVEAHQVIADEIVHYAVWHGHVNVAAFAIHNCMADPNACDDFDLRPLHFAIVRNQPDLARLLLAEGADVHACGGNSIALPRSLQMKTPLELATTWIYSDIEAVAMVLYGKICLHCNDKFPMVPLFTTKQCLDCEYFYCRQHCFEHHRCSKSSEKGVMRLDSVQLVYDEHEVVEERVFVRPCSSKWYCTHRDCHGVFNLFRKRYKCGICNYSVCSLHVKSLK
ncbi:hypothetical protein H310_02282 [Aphanomyces invadans]|uniref:Rab-GAP TBC domain-containing protein n=1 Tax=Aphanomyces invadans TaxID=157072 RepID=A0A024UN50_9STRA|nr:hypothetical protein H310_02282 [Aphanomyces invadans]ETW07861.1 hypothetical protein H310_02282 [Aphanomyces invadans]|eukprot:XP_008863954.1 hypothetical protein H310_02282 [Aphanomyces invadans]